MNFPLIVHNILTNSTLFGTLLVIFTFILAMAALYQKIKDTASIVKEDEDRKHKITIIIDGVSVAIEGATAEDVQKASDLTKKFLKEREG